jgi:hypothetical protein
MMVERKLRGAAVFLGQGVPVRTNGADLSV